MARRVSEVLEAEETADATTPQPGRRTDVVYSVLQANIAANRLEAGLVLTESSVSRAFNVSRSPAAAALDRLSSEGLIHELPGRGFAVGKRGLLPIRKDLFAGGLSLESSAVDELEKRGWRDRLYPQVEREVSACLAFGNFRIVGASLADAFGVSRTVAHEVLTRLERVGLVTQAHNGHWYAPQLTQQGVRDHYQIRILLEPIALVDGAQTLPPGDLDEKLARAKDYLARSSNVSESDITQAENDLHRDIVLKCSNEQMRRVIFRSQLPLIATHLSFERHLRRDEIHETLKQHIKVLRALKSGKFDAAADALRQHLESAREATLACLDAMPPVPVARIPKYMTPA